MVRVVAALLSCLMVVSAHAAPAQAYAFMGGWAYDVTGSYTNTSRLDLEDDLGLQSKARQNYALGYTPAALGYVPALEFDYTRIAASGQQRFATLPVAGLDPLTGGVIASETVVDDRTSVNDFELTARWPWRQGAFTLLGGLTLTVLDGNVQVADENSGQLQNQKVSEVFPLLSLGVEWQASENLSLQLSGDYIRYDGNRADELEARVLWQVLGPVGLQVGYRQRRYKIDEPMNALDARVAGARLGVVIALPL